MRWSPESSSSAPSSGSCGPSRSSPGPTSPRSSARRRLLVVLTLALIIPLTAGDYDLSVASVLTLSGMLLAVLNAQHGWPLWAAMGVALASGVVTGIVNAGFILFFRIPSLIVTLGTGSFINGVVLWVSGSMTVSGVSEDLIDWVVVRRRLRYPAGVLLRDRLCFALWYFFEYTTGGRRTSLRRPRPRGCPPIRHQGRPRSLV